MTTDEMNNDDGDVRQRMRKRFQAIDEVQRRKEEASSAWVMVLFFGFLITFIGLFMILLILGVITLTLEIVISTGIILFGAFIMAIAFFIKDSPSLIIDEL